MTVLPNIYDREQLREFALASDAPAISDDEMARITELVTSNFGLEEAPGRYKGTMTREAAGV